MLLNFNIYVICTTIGEPRSWALPVFHTLTGCDTTLAYTGKLAWQAWLVYEDATDTFQYLVFHLFEFMNNDSIYFGKLKQSCKVLLGPGLHTCSHGSQFGWQFLRCHAKVCSELIKCYCINCKCGKANLVCLQPFKCKCNNKCKYHLYSFHKFFIFHWLYNQECIKSHLSVVLLVLFFMEIAV